MLKFFISHPTLIEWMYVVFDYRNIEPFFFAEMEGDLLNMKCLNSFPPSESNTFYRTIDLSQEVQSAKVFSVPLMCSKLAWLMLPVCVLWLFSFKLDV